MPRYYSKTGTGRASRLEGPLELAMGYIGDTPAVKVSLGKRVMSFTEAEVRTMLGKFAERRRKPFSAPDPDTLVVTSLGALQGPK